MKIPAALAKAVFASLVTCVLSGSAALTMRLMHAAGGSKSVVAISGVGAAASTSVPGAEFSMPGVGPHRTAPTAARSVQESKGL